MDAGGTADPPGDADLLYQPGAPDGLSLLPSQGVADRLGAVESACKSVVGQRLKGAGMRWGEASRPAAVACTRCMAFCLRRVWAARGKAPVYPVANAPQ